MTCSICGKEFEGRSDAKFCSGACRIKAHRVTDNSKNDQNVTDNVVNDEIAVTEPKIKVDAKPDDATDNTGGDNSELSVFSEGGPTVSDAKPGTFKEPKGNKWDRNLDPEKDPLKRITQIPTGKVNMEYYHSQTYKNLIEELESKTITQLEKEKYFIPAWKISGYKKRSNLKELLK